MRALLGMAMALILLAGCASTETVIDSKGEGINKLYSATFENVYAANLDFVTKRNVHEKPLSTIILEVPIIKGKKEYDIVNDELEK